jgi:DeoR/GlpR family transcriptional regulator of sugar metabolism
MRGARRNQENTTESTFNKKEEQNHEARMRAMKRAVEVIRTMIQ